MQTAATAQSCDVRQVAAIPVTAERGFVSAPATIEGKHVTLLIDTGAELTMVTPNAMVALHLGQDRHTRTTINGTGGSLTSQNALLQSLGIGGLDVLDQTAAVGPLPVLTGSALHASGLLGADWLHDFDVELDLPHNRVSLYRIHGCSGDYVPWPGPRTTAVAGLYGRGLVLLPATLDGQPVTAMLDSGANRSVLVQSAADRLGLTAAALARDRSSKAVGVDGNVQAVREHPFTELRVAGLRTTGQVVGISAVHAPAELLLGADWLRGVRVWISYANHRVTVQPG